MLATRVEDGRGKHRPRLGRSTQAHLSSSAAQRSFYVACAARRWLNQNCKVVLWGIYSLSSPAAAVGGNEWRLTVPRAFPLPPGASSGPIPSRSRRAARQSSRAAKRGVSTPSGTRPAQPARESTSVPNAGRIGPCRAKPAASAAFNSGRLVAAPARGGHMAGAGRSALPEVRLHLLPRSTMLTIGALRTSTVYLWHTCYNL
jgi:hypothetical protein